MVCYCETERATGLAVLLVLIDQVSNAHGIMDEIKLLHTWRFSQRAQSLASSWSHDI